MKRPRVWGHQRLWQKSHIAKCIQKEKPQLESRLLAVKQVSAQQAASIAQTIPKAVTVLQGCLQHTCFAHPVIQESDCSTAELRISHPQRPQLALSLVTANHRTRSNGYSRDHNAGAGISWNTEPSVQGVLLTLSWAQYTSVVNIRVQSVFTTAVISTSQSNHYNSDTVEFCCPTPHALNL